MGQTVKSDKYATPSGEVTLTLVGHGSVMVQWSGKTIQVDPYSRAGDYSKLPKADLLLITHEHGDHLDKTACEKILAPATHIIANPAAAEQLKGAEVLKNGQSTSWNGILIEAVPAYNIEHMRAPGQPYHPQGSGNGYVLNFVDFRVYIAGDTENIPEMKNLGRIDAAFLPKNLPHTMTDGMLVDAAKMVAPKVLYIYHNSPYQVSEFQEKLPDTVVK
ncbi:MAG: MBL fold metallo-hydrolase [Rikenellaceae bacterium]|jgi:L-ascorbate metabolism protein UlaG (beta-lactamase superfamily)|nr:MBL fold metallo-hydrolase [Rikenellaceae bacterium]